MAARTLGVALAALLTQGAAVALGQDGGLAAPPTASATTSDPGGSLLSAVGALVGDGLAPFFGKGAEFRQARFFHPSGLTYYGHVTSVATDPTFQPEAKRLEGAVLARMGGGLLKFADGDDGPVLDPFPGIALRFEQPTDPVTPASHPGDLDLTFCAYTERFRTLVTGISFFKADASDFMKNDYFPDVPFNIEGVGDVWLRLAPKQAPTTGSFRAERFNNTVRAGNAVFTLEAQRVNTSWTREWLGVDVATLAKTFSWSQATASNPWIPLVEIQIDRLVDIDQGQLKFDPQSSARGLTPKGLVTAIRGPVYKASQDARPQHQDPVKLIDKNKTPVDDGVRPPNDPRSEGFIHKIGGP